MELLSYRRQIYDITSKKTNFISKKYVLLTNCKKKCSKYLQIKRIIRTFAAVNIKTYTYNEATDECMVVA